MGRWCCLVCPFHSSLSPCAHHCHYVLIVGTGLLEQMDGHETRNNAIGAAIICIKLLRFELAMVAPFHRQNETRGDSWTRRRDVKWWLYFSYLYKCLSFTRNRNEVRPTGQWNTIYWPAIDRGLPLLLYLSDGMARSQVSLRANRYLKSYTYFSVLLYGDEKELLLLSLSQVVIEM